MDNSELKKKYDDMHRTGKGAWFDDGQQERNAIFEMGKPWHRERVLEIGCGEADLLDMIKGAGALVSGIDYSLEAITTAKNRYPYLDVMCCNWEEWPDSRNEHFDAVVMQGVMEHFDNPWKSLDGIIAKFTPKTVITSMPCFLNARGLVWMTLDMLGAVMSKTDLHYINPWDVQAYCFEKKYKMIWNTIDQPWASGGKMCEDLKNRIPLALNDGGLCATDKKRTDFIQWLNEASYWLNGNMGMGAVAIYRIDT